MTTDEEREAVLWQNELLRERYGTTPGLFQKLRRCAICLRNSCEQLSDCRGEFTAWSEKKWNNALLKQLGVSSAIDGH